MRRSTAAIRKTAAATTVAALALGALTACGSGDGGPLSTVRGLTASPTASAPTGDSAGNTKGGTGGATGIGNTDNAELGVQELVRRAKQAAAALKTVHIVADVRNDGVATQLDLRIDRDTEDYTGFVVQDGAKLDVIRHGNDVYVRGDEEAIRTILGSAAGDAAKLIAGKWIQRDIRDSGASGMAEITGIADPGAILEDFPEDGVKLPVENVGGRDMVPVTGGPGEEDVRVYIEAQGGRPYPVMFVSDDVDNGGSISYGDFDVPVRVTVPPASEVIRTPGSGVRSTPPPPSATA